MIRANVHTDDRHYDVDFDATAWFEQASDQEIIELADCGWRGDYPADAVAEFMADHNNQIQRLFDYLSHDPRTGKDPIGFECSVNEGDARAWLKEHRPQI